MRKPEGIVEIFLQPGEHYFGDRYTRIRTLLGSCVSLVFWHPNELVGGMCHYMLPTRRCQPGQGKSCSPPEIRDGRYADEAIALMLDDIHSMRLLPEAFRVQVFGGGDMFPHLKRRNQPSIGSQNVLRATELIRQHCLRCVSAHVEGTGHRHVIFDIWSGHVALKYIASPA